VLAVGHRGDVLEEPPLICTLGREVDRKAGLGTDEPTVDVTVRDWSIAPLVDIDIRFGEHLVGRF
jgi:hypothetical protein